MSTSVALGSVSDARIPATSLTRTAGFAGLAFALVVGLLNVFLGVLSPPLMNASGAEVVQFVTANKPALTFTLGVVPAGIFLLFVFIASAFPVLGSGSEQAAFWARFGALGIVLVEVMFLTRTLSEVVLVANIDRLATDHLMVETLWQLQGAAMTANGLALAVALTGLSRAARLSGIIPAWQEAMGYAAAVAFVVNAIGVIPALEGSAIGILGLPAFITWIVWLGITGSRLIRRGELAA